MKNPKLRFRAKGVDRDFYLFRRLGQKDWYIKFVPPKWVRKQLGRNVLWRSTQTAEIEAAKRIGAGIIASYWKDAGLSAEEAGLTSHTGFVTIGALLERYESMAKERSRTAKSNGNALRRIIEIAVGPNPDERSTSILTAQLIRDFERKSESNPTSISSYLTQARSIFSPRKMKFYDGLRLPDLTAFRAEKVERPAVTDLEPLDLNALRAMDAAAPKLAVDDPGAYVAHLLFSRLAMRNIEIWSARESWIVDGRIGLIARPKEGFKPKGRSGWIPISPDVLAELNRFRHLCTDGYLVPGANKTERQHAIYRRHSEWVSMWIKDKTKTSYELRRYAGSRLLDLGASMLEVRDFLRHRNIQTTERWYAYRLQNRGLPMIGMRNLVPAAA